MLRVKLLQKTIMKGTELDRDTLESNGMACPSEKPVNDIAETIEILKEAQDTPF